MDIVMYLLVGILATYIGRIEKRVNIAAVSIPLAIPLAFFSALGAVVAMIVIFKGMLVVIALLFLILAKLKFLLGAKIIGFFASIAAAFLGIAAGPIGWILIAFGICIFFVVLKNALISSFWQLYSWFFQKFVDLLFWVRRKADAARNWLYPPFRFLVLFFEVPIVCGSSAYSLWEAMDLLDGKGSVADIQVVARLICLAPFVYYAYKAYIQDTAPPQSGGDGLETPMPIQATDLI